MSITTAVYSEEQARCAVRGTVPARVLHPSYEREVAEILRAARDAHEAVVPVGGATMLDIGDAPTRYEVAVVMDRITGIVEYNPGDLTIVVRAGTTLSEVVSELGKHNQVLSIEAPQPDQATIGGVLAANASGPLRLSYGSPRDAVIGVRVALPNGQIAKSGGRVVKNVAGYDLSKLFIGSFGTLGIIVEAALKVHPRPETIRSFVVTTSDMAGAMNVAAAVAGLGPGLLSLAVLNGRGAEAMGWAGPAVVVVVGGGATAIGELVADVTSCIGMMNAAWFEEPEPDRVLAELRDYSGHATLRISGRNSITHTLIAASEEVEALVYPTVGTSYVCAPQWRPEDVTAVRRETARTGGHVVVWQGSRALDGISSWGDVGPEIALMRAVKSVFDPGQNMSPGRFVGDI